MEKTHFINGQWLEGKGKKFNSLDPAKNIEIWQGKSAIQQQIDDAVFAARKAFDAWSELNLDDRKVIVQAFQTQLEVHQEELAMSIAMETGKPLWESRTEVAAMKGKVAISIQAHEERTSITENIVADGTRSVLRHKPHGVVAVFGPYNFPGHLPNGHIIPALLAGNTVVFKPSELTPLVAEKTMQYWEKAGMPAGVINLLQGEKETGILLSKHADINGLFFTGSSATGHVLHQQFAGDPSKILALEMGGNNPLIVENVADQRAAVFNTIQSAYVSAGQRCTCARRIYVPRTNEGDEFVKQLIAAIQKIVVGFYDDEKQPFMGSLISTQAVDELIQAQENLVKLGAEILVEMKKLVHGPAFLSPGLIDGSKIEQLPDQEYFGPLLVLIRYDTFVEAIKMANNTDYGLSAGLLSDEKESYQMFMKKIRAGIVNWNKPLTGASSAAPFGGIGHSGNHRASAYYAADYCAFPVASMEAEKVSVPDHLPPGITL